MKNILDYLVARRTRDGKFLGKGKFYGPLLKVVRNYLLLEHYENHFK